MFDALKNLGNLGDMMKKAQEMQSKMQQMQEEMARKQITAEAAGGLVTATVNGKMQLVNLKIDKTKGDASDLEFLEDVIVAAVTAAQNQAAEQLQGEMSKLTGGLNLPPGLMGG